jgi:hypothetical protein
MLASTSTAAGAVRNPKLDEYEVGGTKYGKHGMETNVTLQSGPSLAAGNLAGPSAVFFAHIERHLNITMYALHSSSFSNCSQRLHPASQ